MPMATAMTMALAMIEDDDTHCHPVLLLLFPRFLSFLLIVVVVEVDTTTTTMMMMMIL